MSTPPITVHIIAQAHIDPVWLWPWQSGLDEMLATCRTACELLDAYPDFIFTRGEAWGYQQIESVDPPLFARIRRHIDAGRWEVVGGWWIQPDCNFPSGFGFERQIEVGKQYLLERFGTFPEVGYNVDSFGHAATLPGYLRAAGQRYYVMMRPGKHELALPARLFKWRGYVDGPDVLTFRIADSYCTAPIPGEEHVRNALSELPEGVTHTMCFVGVGDHGGGATAEMIEWVAEHADAFDGCRLVFSSPGRFFRAIEQQAPRLPLVTGELQYHAIGCYSVHREIKTAVRRAEHRLRQAEIICADHEPPPAELPGAWQRVAFNHFHDILGGTSIASAYRQCTDQLGHASMVADDLVHHALRRRLAALPDDPLQRLVFCNASDSPFHGYVECLPWTNWRWDERWQLLDERQTPMPYQNIWPEHMADSRTALLLPITAAAGELRVLKIDTDGDRQPLANCVHVDGAGMRNDAGVSLTLGAPGSMRYASGITLPLPRLDLIDDRTDNWTHRFDRYPEGPVESPRWNAPSTVCTGPLMAALQQTGDIGDNRLCAEWRLYAGEPCVELRLNVQWNARRQLLKCTLPLPAVRAQRRDGIPGSNLLRDNDGMERPLRDWTLLGLAGGGYIGIVSPDCFALDVNGERARLTLLRSPVLTHHEPGLAMRPDAVYADQGVHEFRFRFFVADALEAALLDEQALMMHRPLIAADLTRGMPRRII